MIFRALSGWRGSVWLLAPVIAGLLSAGPALTPALAQVVPLPLSLKDVPAPEPTNLYAFLKGNPQGTPEERLLAARAKQAATVLGKALFWDMQVGSDNVQACASCHFNAGADFRAKNQLSPGLSGTPPDTLFGNPSAFVPPGTPGHPNFGPNITVTASDFPFHERFPATAPVDRFQPDSEFLTLVRDTNDVMSSQGVKQNDDAALSDSIFHWKNFDQRRVEPRNAPTMINAVFHLDMFWDGRASFIFNGVNPFGFRDRDSKVKRNLGTAASPNVQEVLVRIPFAAHASQAVGPPLSSFEMSGIIRTFPDLGNKLLHPDLVPLARQVVHPQDSVLGPYALADFVRNKQGKPTGKLNNVPGLSKIAAPFTDTNGNGRLDYADMVRAAFKEEWWNGSPTQMADNFTLFFGLAVQLYQALLISDDTPFDQFMGANANVRGNGAPIPPRPEALTPQALLGLDIFQGTNLSGQNPTLINGGCTNCHILPETSNHVVRLMGVQAPAGVTNDPLDPVNVLVPQLLLEVMLLGDNTLGVYDTGFYNIGVRPTEEDHGRFGSAPPTNGFPEGLPFSYAELALLKLSGQLPPDVAQFVPDQGADELGNILPLAQLFAQTGNRVVTRGAFKVPNLRNQEFMGPYFHNGGDATLRHVVEFYTRGGNFPATNIAHLDADILPLPDLDTLVPGDLGDQHLRALVAFLSQGLTDPRVANRQAPFDHPQLFIPEGATGKTPQLDKMIEIKPTGRTGGVPLARFLGLDPQTP